MKRKSLLFALLLAFIAPWAANAQTLNEGFESTTFPPTDWEAIHVSGSNSWARYTSYKHNGNASAYAHWASSGHENYLITPKLVPAIGESLSFFVSAQSYSGTTLKIELSTTLATAASFTTVLATYTTGSSGTIGTTDPSNFVEKTIDLSSYVGQHIYIAFHVIDSNGGDVIIDDITGVTLYVPTCVRPTLGEAEYISEEGASFQWTENGTATNWVLEYSTNEIFTNATSVTRSGIPNIAITGLNSGTTYYAHLKSNCGGGDESDWSNTVSFTTLCEAINAEGYSENFDDYEMASAYTAPAERVLPDCWSAINTTTYSTYSVFPTIYYYSSTNYANSTPNSLKFYSNAYYTNYDPQPQYAILPPMNGLAGMQVTLQARGYNTSSTFKIGTMSDPTDASTFTMITEQTGLTTSYQEFEYLVPADCSDKYLAIMIEAANSSRTYNGVYIDDIVIVSPPTCIRPSSLEVTATTTTTATLGWTNGAEGQTAWQIAYSTDPTFDPDNVTPADVTSNPGIINGLTAATIYYAYVRANCGDFGYSDWSATYCQFATACDAITNFPWSEDFEDYAEGDFSDPCWVNEHISGSGSKIFKVYTSTTGTNSTHQLQLPDQNNGTLTKLRLPVMTLPGNDYQFAIDVYRSSSYEDKTGEGIRVYASTNGEIEGATELAFIPRYYGVANGVIPAETTGNKWYTYQLPIGFSGTCYIILRGENKFGTSTYMDNFFVEQIPNCPKPTSLAVTSGSVDAHGATITWVEEGEATTWIVEFANNADFENYLNETVENEPTYTFHGLAPETTYYVRVKAHCGEGDESVYCNNIVNFTTDAACKTPTNLTCTTMTATTATLSWTESGESTAWQICLNNDEEHLTDIDTDDVTINEGVVTYQLGGLTSVTAYTAKVRGICNNEPTGWSNVANFTTLQVAVNLPYSTDFENGNDWLFVNGDLTNAWAYGEATSNGGTHALYISNDGGTTNAYTSSSASMVYATKLFNFEDGIYVFSYDWKANGEGGYDYLRVALLPSSVQLAASTTPSGFDTSSLPTGWIALDGGGKLNLKSDWQYCASDEIEVAAGTYMMVFAWKDDTSSGSNPPAAIDNVSIAKITCTRPTGLDAPQSGITATSAQLSWTETGEATAWQICLNGDEANPIGINTNTQGVTMSEGTVTYVMSNLTPETAYTVKVRTNCNADDQSEWCAPVSFTTDCEAVTSFPWSETFEDYSSGTFSASCWVNEHISGSGTNTFSVYTSTNGTNSTHQLYLPDMFSGTLTKLILPVMTLPGDDYQFVIDVYRNATGSSYTSEGVRVYASTDGEIDGATELGFLYRNYTQTDGGVVVAESAAGWYTYAFPIGFSGTCYIILRGESKYGNGTYLDNFKVKQIPTCLAPTALEVTATTMTTVTLSWTNGAANQTAWQICLNGDEANPIMADSNPFTIDEEGVLAPATAYTVKVRAYCSENDQSEWSDEVSFATECEPIVVVDAAHPFTEDFSTWVPLCWELGDNVSGNRNWVLYSGAAYSGYFGTIDLYMPTLNITAITGATPMLRFQSKEGLTNYYTGGTYDAGGLNIVKISTDNGSTWTQLWCPTIDELTSSYRTVTLGLENYVGQDILIAFEYQGNDAHTWYIDDVKIVYSFTLDIDGYANNNPDGGYYLIASPLNEAIDPTDVEGMIATPAENYDLYRFNQGADIEWENYLTHTDDFVLEPGKGYLYASAEDTQLVFTGVPYSGNGEVTLTMAEESEGLDFPAWNLVGNPFAVEAYITDRGFYAMDEDGVRILAELQTRAIQPMEGVFVVAEQDEEVITFTTEAPQGKGNIALNLSHGGRGRTLDRAFVGVGQGHALPKFMFNQNDTKMYIPENGEDFAVVYKRSSGEVPVNFEPTEDGIYGISVDVRNMNLSSLILKDRVRNVTIDLLRTPNYMFRASTEDRADRFVLSFRTNPGVYKERVVKGANSDDFGFFSNGNWIIDNEGEATLQVIDLNGRVLSSETIYGSTSIQVDAAPGVYMLRLINGDNMKVQKVVVE